MTPEEEGKYIGEVSTLSKVPVSITHSIVSTQIAMVLRDLGIKKEANTVLGKIKIEDGNLVLVNPNQQLLKYLNSDFIRQKIFSEIPEI
jgi:hypothetical protein